MGGSAKVGKRGAVVIPAPLRKKYGLKAGSSVLFEEGPSGVVIRPAMTARLARSGYREVPVEGWSQERKAGFILENAVDSDDYERARAEVRRMGLDPDHIPHQRPEP
jgi:AbrB family looped-hinge helix DNA binding protein